MASTRGTACCRRHELTEAFVGAFTELLKAAGLYRSPDGSLA